MYLLTCAPNEDSNQPAHPRSLIRIFIVRMTKLCIICNPKCVQWRFWSDCANAQADLNLRWTHISESMFPDVAAPISCELVSSKYMTIMNVSHRLYVVKYIYFLVSVRVCTFVLSYKRNMESHSAVRFIAPRLKSSLHLLLLYERFISLAVLKVCLFVRMEVLVSMYMYTEWSYKHENAYTGERIVFIFSFCSRLLIILYPAT